MKTEVWVRIGIAAAMALIVFAWAFRASDSVWRSWTYCWSGRACRDLLDLPGGLRDAVFLTPESALAVLAPTAIALALGWFVGRWWASPIADALDARRAKRREARERKRVEREILDEEIDRRINQ